MKSTLLQIQELRRKKYIFEEHSTQGLDLPRGFHFVEDQEKISKAGCSGWGRFIPPTYRWSNERPGTSPFRHGTARHGLTGRPVGGPLPRPNRHHPLPPPLPLRLPPPLLIPQHQRLRCLPPSTLSSRLHLRAAASLCNEPVRGAAQPSLVPAPPCALCCEPSSCCR